MALEITGDPGLLVESPAVTVTVALDLTLNRDPIHVATNAGTLELSGHITARNFVKQGAGTLVLSGANADITDLIGEDGCGVIRATNPLALGVSLVGRIQLGQNCTLQVEADTTLDKPIIVNGLGAPGTTGALVITAGVTLTERLELRLDSPAKISVLSGATLDLPQSAVGLTMNLNSPLTVNVAAGWSWPDQPSDFWHRRSHQGGRGNARFGQEQHLQRPDHHQGRHRGHRRRPTRQSGGPGWGDGGWRRTASHGHDQRDRGRRHHQRRAVRGRTRWAAAA